MKGIVIGIDESAGSTAALRWAVREGEVTGQRLTALLGWGSLDRHYVVLGERFDRGYDLQEADDALLAVIEAAVGIESARRIGRKVVTDSAAHALVSAGADADLLVVGARGGGGFNGLRLGSVAEQCLRHAPCPVAVIRLPDGPDTAVPPLRRVVVGFDGSPSAQLALRWAIDEALVHQAGLEVVNAWQPSLARDELTADVETGGRHARKVLAEVLDAEDTAGLSQPPMMTVVHGATAATILAVAERADLLVLGSRGSGGFAGLQLGSVGQQAAIHASCPVVVVPCNRSTDVLAVAARGAASGRRRDGSTAPADRPAHAVGRRAPPPRAPDPAPDPLDDGRAASPVPPVLTGP